MVTVSDASESGGGVRYFTGISSSGVEALKLWSQLGQPGQEGLLVVSVFEGISAIQVALERLGCAVLGCVCIESDDVARKVVKGWFPRSVSLCDVCSVSYQDVSHWVRLFLRASLVLVTGGPPCQGVSGLNASRTGAEKDPRSSLNIQFKHLFEWVKSAFCWCPVHFMQESVATMDSRDRRIYSRVADLLPIHMDSDQMGWVRRPRLFWFDWKMWEDECFKLNVRGSYSRCLFWV